MRSISARISAGKAILWPLAIFGIVLIIYRYAMGLGAVTNLSDGYPWGLWIGFDILAGIALASGGFMLAGTVHLFGRRKYEPLARAAILTAFLGYIFYIFGLMVDLGRPWNIWKVIIYWHHESPMFWVAWSVMFSSIVIFLEFLPMAFEKYRWERAHAIWREAVPWLIVGLLAVFTLAMTYSWKWTLAIVVILLAWEILMRTGVMPRDMQMPILLIIAGVIFGTLHQSVLGSVFLIVPHKLHTLWYSPILPWLFLASAIMVGPAMVIFEGLVSERALGEGGHFGLLADLAKAMPYLLAIYLLMKVADLVGSGAVNEALTLSPQSVVWWGEVTVGVIVPLALFLTPEVRESRGLLFLSAFLVVIGVIWNRLNVAIVGVIVREWETYYPYWMELFITAGILAIGLLVLSWCTKNLPIYEREAVSAAQG